MWNDSFMNLNKIRRLIGFLLVVGVALISISCAKLQSSYDQDYLYPDQERYSS